MHQGACDGDGAWRAGQPTSAVSHVMLTSCTPCTNNKRTPPHPTCQLIYFHIIMDVVRAPISGESGSGSRIMRTFVKGNELVGNKLMVFAPTQPGRYAKIVHPNIQGAGGAVLFTLPLLYAARCWGAAGARACVLPLPMLTLAPTAAQCAYRRSLLCPRH